MRSPTHPPVVLSIAGSDSGGGAGIAADLKTFHIHGVHGTMALTCVTAQNTLGVRSIERLSTEMIVAQIAAVLDDLAPAAAKTGFLAGLGGIEAVATALPRLPQLVVDPVCVDKFNRPILDVATLEALRLRLFPYATLLTPNVAEAALLSGQPVGTRQQMERAAEKLLESGAKAVLVKGGRLEGERSADLLVTTDGAHDWLDGPRVHTLSVHGSGDTLSATITARLACGDSLHAAVHAAKRYVTRCLEQALTLGAGQGPVGHPPAQ